MNYFCRVANKLVDTKADKLSELEGIDINDERQRSIRNNIVLLNPLLTFISI